MVAAQLKIFVHDFQVTLKDLECSSLQSERLYNILRQHRARIDVLCTQTKDSSAALYEALYRLHHQIDMAIRETFPATAMYDRLAVAYEGLLHQLRHHQHWKEIAHSAQTLRPTNYMRNIVHIGNGLLAFSLYEWIFNMNQTIIGLSILLTVYITIDIARRYSTRVHVLVFERILKKVTRPRELYQTPAGVWYVVGLLAAVLIASQTAAQIAALTLAFGDPIASIVGKKYGRTAIGRNRSLEGSLAFVGVSSSVVAGFLLCFRGFSLSSAIIWALVAAIFGALAEYASNDRFDDNVMIPILVALSLALLGFPI